MQRNLQPVERRTGQKFIYNRKSLPTWLAMSWPIFLKQISDGITALPHNNIKDFLAYSYLQ